MLTLRPLNEYVDVNHFKYSDRLQLIQGNGGVYYVQMWDLDAGCNNPTAGTGSSSGLLGSIYGAATPVFPGQRFIPTATSTVQVAFLRTPTIAAVPLNQDVIVPAVQDLNDSSIFKITLSAAQVDIIISGGVKLLVTDLGVTTTWPVDWFVNRRTNIPGA